MVRITCGPGLHTCVWNESLTTSQKQAWQLLPPPGDCRGGAFATFVANERYVDPAICLRRQLRRVGSECPAIALFDDREDAASGLSGASRERLAHAYGAQSLIPLTQLLRRAGAEPTNLSQYGRGGGDPMFGVRQPLVRPPRRQLFETRQGSSEWNALFLKLFFWAIDPAKYPRVVLLDADLLLRHSLDPLLAHEFTSAVAGVPCTDDINYFNTGVMVLRPSLPTLRFLLRTRPGKKCENKITDQSVINLYFQHRGWDPLRFPYNVPHRLHAGAPESFWSHAAAAVIHFTGEPKPWEPRESLRRAFKQRRAASIVNEYRSVCGLDAV